MNQQPLITVGIPTFNRPEGLRTTLSRITTQTYANLEILVSDNASEDEAAVRAVIDDFTKRDARIRYFRQPQNLGSIGNFRFLVGQATGEFFLWAADDDELDPPYVEVLWRTFSAHPGAAIAMTGYDVVDTISHPTIYTNLSAHLSSLCGATPFIRLQNYVRQPDHLGKSRLVWGLFRRTDVVRAFDECLAAVPKGGELGWADLPIDFRLLSYGDLCLASEVLFHVRLLPTSEGRRGLAHKLPKLLGTAERWARACQAVVDSTDLSPSERAQLGRRIARKCRRDKLDLFIYYGVIGRFPGLARQIKKLIYRLT